ncbi:LysR family transcriptional regulator [Variovorax sp. J2P1-59]|uniref:LysR family transcriptional regulator n=1 Tax=Variovorax flavidus TaxID=3053501 RepID=UPI00257651D2|nr:LysR family transcriptional regulator [Variovorax sp. J2P1-59]MDM0074787.1 LysR family transcriptional regulator [Variovorax sp. J2P1-59]
MTHSAVLSPETSPLTLRSDPLASSFATTYAGVVAFIAVVTEGSFARAADRLGIGRSAVSRSVQKLEDQLNVRLFLRTTRSTTLTREGDLFYANCHTGVDRIVQAVEEMRDLREGPPRGHLRISSPMGFGRRVVAPLLGEFRAAYPDVSIDLLLDDKPTDFISDRVDIAFRNGRLEDAQIIAKQIIPMQMLVCASPAYRDAHGLPDSVDDLARHQCVNFRHGSGRVYEWEFKVDGQIRKFQPQARITYNDPSLVLQAVLDGHGVAQMAGYLVCDALRSGALVPCLTRYAPDDRGHYICYLSRQHLPSRMRVFIDFMTTRIRASDLQCLTDFGMGAGASVATA